MDSKAPGDSPNPNPDDFDPDALDDDSDPDVKLKTIEPGAERKPMPTAPLPPTEAEAGHEELAAAIVKHTELMGQVEKERLKKVRSESRREKARQKLLKEAAELGIPPEEIDWDELPPAFVPDTELQRQFHAQHHVIAKLEKGLGVRQPEENETLRILDKLGLKIGPAAATAPADPGPAKT